MDNGHEQAHFKVRNSNIQHAFIINQGNISKNHNEISLHSEQRLSKNQENKKCW